MEGFAPTREKEIEVAIAEICLVRSEQIPAEIDAAHVAQKMSHRCHQQPAARTMLAEAESSDLRRLLTPHFFWALRDLERTRRREVSLGEDTERTSEARPELALDVERVGRAIERVFDRLDHDARPGVVELLLLGTVLLPPPMSAPDRDLVPKVTSAKPKDLFNALNRFGIYSRGARDPTSQLREDAYLAWLHRTLESEGVTCDDALRLLSTPRLLEACEPLARRLYRVASLVCAQMVAVTSGDLMYQIFHGDERSHDRLSNDALEAFHAQLDTLYWGARVDRTILARGCIEYLSSVEGRDTSDIALATLQDPGWALDRLKSTIDGVQDPMDARKWLAVAVMGQHMRSATAVRDDAYLFDLFEALSQRSLTRVAVAFDLLSVVGQRAAADVDRAFASPLACNRAYQGIVRQAPRLQDRGQRLRDYTDQRSTLECALEALEYPSHLCAIAGLKFLLELPARPKARDEVGPFLARLEAARPPPVVRSLIATVRAHHAGAVAPAAHFSKTRTRP